MKQIALEVEDVVYEYYRRIANATGIPLEHIMADSLFRCVGDMSRIPSEREKKDAQ